MRLKNIQKAENKNILSYTLQIILVCENTQKYCFPQLDLYPDFYSFHYVSCILFYVLYSVQYIIVSFYLKQLILSTTLVLKI